jgi:hypothetical protein
MNVKVVWYVQGYPEFRFESQVSCATDFLKTLKLVNVVAYEGEEYKVIDTELVVDTEPYLVILLEG